MFPIQLKPIFDLILYVQAQVEANSRIGRFSLLVLKDFCVAFCYPRTFICLSSSLKHASPETNTNIDETC